MKPCCVALCCATAIVFCVSCGPSAEEQATEQIQKVIADPEKIMLVIGHANPAVRLTQADRLGNLGQAAIDAGAIPKLEEMAKDDPDERVREAAKAALEKLNAL